MDRRIGRLERHKADKTEVRELARAMGRRFDRLERATARLQNTKMDKAELRRAMTRLRREIVSSSDGTHRSLREEIAASAEETRRSLREEIAASEEETRRLLREEIAASAEETRRYLREEMLAIAVETRRHFDTTIENLPARFQGYGDGIMANHAKIENHEVRISRLEQHSGEPAFKSSRRIE